MGEGPESGASAGAQLRGTWAVETPLSLRFSAGLLWLAFNEADTIAATLGAALSL